jgi:hypothetical protein
MNVRTVPPQPAVAGGTATRTSFVPEGTELFFPVINSVKINTPNVCGQVGHLSVSELRAMSAALCMVSMDSGAEDHRANVVGRRAGELEV